MSAFTEATFTPTGRRRGGRELFRIDGLAFDIGRKGSGQTIRVPDGFETDGPTIPAWAWRLIPTERLVKWAALHDFMRERLGYTKLTGDAIFLSAMEAEGTPAWLRWPAFLAVLANNSRARATD